MTDLKFQFNCLRIEEDVWSTNLWKFMHTCAKKQVHRARMPPHSPFISKSTNVKNKLFYGKFQPLRVPLIIEVVRWVIHALLCLITVVGYYKITWWMTKLQSQQSVLWPNLTLEVGRWVTGVLNSLPLGQAIHKSIDTRQSHNWAKNLMLFYSL